MELPQINNQPKENTTRDNGYFLEWVDVWKTIQGEGPFIGHPAVFVRLAGCNLQCPNCDTNYTEGRQRGSVADLVKRISQVMGRHQCLIVITGGEPFRQNIVPLLKTLTINKGLNVQIETNGTIYREDIPFGPNLTIVCSPKTSQIHSKWKTSFKIDALKYIVNDNNLLVDKHLGEVFTNSALGKIVNVQSPWDSFEGDVYVSPEDCKDEEHNKRNLQAAVRIAQNNNWILTFQLHKLIGVA